MHVIGNPEQKQQADPIASFKDILEGKEELTEASYEQMMQEW